MNLRIVPGTLVCRSFLISVCIFIVSKALLILSATVIVRPGGAIWLNPFSTVCLLCVVPMLRGCVCCYVRKRALLVVGPTPPLKNSGGVQQPFLRTPADGPQIHDM